MEKPSKEWTRTRIAVCEGLHERVFCATKRAMGNCFAICALIIAFGYGSFTLFPYDLVEPSVFFIGQAVLVAGASALMPLLILAAVPVEVLERRFLKDFQG
jgi:hypothetical protein